MVGPRSAEFAEESAEVEVLFAQTKKHEDIGRKIKASLSRIQESENSLQTVAGGPLYNDTQRLQVTERSK
jgi:exocyst complex component 7